MIELNQNGIIHYDLKHENVLVHVKTKCKSKIKEEILKDFSKENLEVVVADYGESKYSQNLQEDWYEPRGTIPFMAPELVLWRSKKSKKHNVKADSWSFGALLYRMITKEAPILSREEAKEISQENFDKEIFKEKYNEGIEIPKDISFELLEVLFHCLRCKIKARWFLKEIRKLDFFKKKSSLGKVKVEGKLRLDKKDQLEEIRENLKSKMKMVDSSSSPSLSDEEENKYNYESSSPFLNSV